MVAGQHRDFDVSLPVWIKSVTRIHHVILVGCGDFFTGKCSRRSDIGHLGRAFAQLVALEVFVAQP